MKLKTALLVAALCVAAPAALFPQTVSQVVNTIAVGGITGLGTGVATLLGGNSSGTGGPAGTTTPTFTTPVLGAATATSINFGGSTLSTYTVGTWTPTIFGASVAGTGQTYTTQSGTYEQIGRQVTVRFNLIITSIGTASGQMNIGGLPVANVSGDLGHCYMSGYSVTGLTALNYGITGQISSAASSIALLSNSSTSNAVVGNAQTGGTPYFQGTCTYRAS